MPKLKALILLIMPVILLQGCAAAVVTGAATGVAVVHDRRSAGTVLDDQSIEIKVSSILYSNKKIYDQSHVNATSYNGVVLLTGETPNEQLKQEVTKEVQTILNVRRVQNELVIAAPSSLPSRSSDAWITSKIKAKLTADKYIDPFFVKVVTEHGVVYLLGLVSHAEADRVVDIVSQSAGVQRVIKIFEYID
ncbi:MAG TPA: BON domain-containing protein [Methylophaga sp.]|nr:BON domain-containing protein [Methylophaga sp.]